MNTEKQHQDAKNINRNDVSRNNEQRSFERGDTREAGERLGQSGAEQRKQDVSTERGLNR